MKKDIIENICIAIFLIPCIWALLFIHTRILLFADWMASSTDWTGKKGEKDGTEKAETSESAD